MSTIDTSTLFTIVIILAVAVVGLAAATIYMYMKLKRFLVDVDAHNIADSLVSVSGDVDELQKFRRDIEGYLANVEKRLRKGVRSVQTVRFNPFRGAGEGGNQSFATVFLNEEGDGVVISSLNAREHIRVFSKPVKGHASDYELSDEEREAMKLGKDGLAF